MVLQGECKLITIPTNISNTVSSPVSVKKGQIYNLDTNEFIGFQFNPRDVIWSRQINYADISWKGSNKGGDIEYLNSGPRKMEISLQYMADPGSPDIDYHINSNNGISTHILKMDFQVLLETIERWEEVIEDKGRPSRLKIIMGSNGFNCVVINSEIRISETFSDLSVREGFITLRLREWSEIIRVQ